MNHITNKNYFTMPNEIFSLGLDASEIAVYAYLRCLESRSTYQCWPSYKRYDADVFTGVNRRTAAVFQFHSAALRRLNKVGCQRYEGDYTRLKQKHAERRARRMAG